MDPVVRRATTSDIADLARMQAMARLGIEAARGGELRLQECAVVVDWLDLIAHPDHTVLIGTLDDAVVSYMVVRLATEQNRGIITHAFVEEPARELGLGNAMVEQAIAVVSEAHLAGIEAVALPGDRETKNMYERVGLTARKLTVYKSLLPKP